MIELQRGYEITSLLPARDCPRIYSPQPDDLVWAAARYAVIFRNVEDSTRDDALVSKHLNGASLIQIPDYNFHVSTRSEQVVLIGLLGAPAYVKDVEYVTIFELFERLDSLVVPCRIEKRRRLPLIVVDWKRLIDSKDSIKTTCGQILPILAELHDPNRLLTNLELMQMLEVIQLHVLLLDDLRLDSENLRLQFNVSKISLLKLLL